MIGKKDRAAHEGATSDHDLVLVLVPVGKSYRHPCTSRSSPSPVFETGLVGRRLLRIFLNQEAAQFVNRIRRPWLGVDHFEKKLPKSEIKFPRWFIR